MFKAVYFSVVFLTFLVIVGCERLEYSPNQIFDKYSPRDLNAKNLEKLYAGEDTADDTIRFVLTGDTQRAYDQAARLVNVVNKIEKLDFVFLNGDISDFGLLQEMKLVAEIYNGLKVPYISVIGNHDLVANGQAVFERMFGNRNFSFVYKGVKFVCHDTNSREYHFDKTAPNIPWLAQEFAVGANVSGIVGVSHVPPISDDFDQESRQQYERMIVTHPKYVANFHSHVNNHSVSYPLDGEIPFIVSNAIINSEFLYVEMVGNKLIWYENVAY
ncbi:metallophosphoesterase family protein [Sphingobacterium sp. SYP-B4668]|uniref:metallophosphoesterase family protein n=1 Tax=Sphingobacterium sp. SYP-B4668 TaxID=2996035 RepID=UPI0022DD8812|nr:metallophosphoesterase [Sphingobacterium sp. SYP-B4668]